MKLSHVVHAGSLGISAAVSILLFNRVTTQSRIAFLVLEGLAK